MKNGTEQIKTNPQEMKTFDQFLSIRLDRETRARLAHESERFGINSSIMVRIAVTRLLAQTETMDIPDLIPLGV